MPMLSTRREKAGSKTPCRSRRRYAGGSVPREGLKDLQTCPLGMGMVGDVEVDDASSVVAQDDEHVEQPKGHSGDHREIDGGR